MVTIEHQLRQGTIVVGVDTHKDTHHAAVADTSGRILADQPFPATTAGYQTLHEWAASFGVIDRVGVELTSSYGAGLTRHLTAAGVEVVEVNTTDKATRARRGKTDQLDAIAAVQKLVTGMATAVPKNTTTVIEAIRVLSVVRDSAVKARTQAINQLKALIVTAPEPLREQLHHLNGAALTKVTAAFKPDNTRISDPTEAVKTGMKRLTDRINDLNTEIRTADHELAALVKHAAPTLISKPQIGTHTAAQFLITASANIDRLHSDAAFARICGAAPIPASSGKTTRMRLHRGGDRQANRALHLIAVGRLKNHPPTITYMTKKLNEGHTRRDTIRALKRYIARDIFHTLKHDLKTT